MSCAARLECVSVTYYEHIALRDVSLEFHRRDFVGIIGPNGAGKTTLLTVINGLGRIRAGTVRVLGEAANARNFGRLRKRIGYVPQHVNIDPRSPINCQEAVMVGRLGRIGLLRRPGRKDVDIVDRMMELTRIAHLRTRPVGQISGGEARKVALARALAQEPEILLLDEPAASLDPRAVEEITGLVTEAFHRFSLTVVMVTHQVDTLPGACNRVVMMKDARILFSGLRGEVLTPARTRELWDDA